MIDLPSLRDLLTLNEKRPPCKRCLDENGIDFATEPEAARPYLMEPKEVWHPTLAAYVNAWVCPECDRRVIRDDEMRTPGEGF